MSNRNTTSRTKPASLRHVSESLKAFVDTLIPGDSLFPAASQVGVQHALAERLRAHHGSDAVRQLTASLCDEGRAFASLSPQQRVRAVRWLERVEPALFAFVRAAAYLAYYQHPVVVQAVRRLGHDYNDAPQPQGYAMPAFDPVVDAPKHQRGFYKRSEEIVPVDTLPLADLLSALPRYPAHHQR